MEIIKGLLSKDVFEEIYEMLNQVDHLNFDCGMLCNKACCQKTEPDMGIYLLPNEHLLLQEETSWLKWYQHPVKEYDFPKSWQGDTFFVSCNGLCPREKRPLQCRTFPLAPYLKEDGSLVLIWETLALPYFCPLILEKQDLNQDFIKTLYQAWKVLIQDPLIKDLISHDSQSRLDYGDEIEIVYQKD